jgi:ABC-type transporter Mla MlaB component
MRELCTFELDEGGVLRLDGELTFASTPDVYRTEEQRLRGESEVDTVDLSGVDRVDSAGLALLLEWQAQRIGSEYAPIRISNAPDCLISLAQLCEAVGLLNLTGRGNPL